MLAESAVAGMVSTLNPCLKFRLYNANSRANNAALNNLREGSLSMSICTDVWLIQLKGLNMLRDISKGRRFTQTQTAVDEQRTFSICTHNAIDLQIKS